MFGKESKREQRKLAESGVRASATVLEVSDRGMTITSGNSQIVANTEVVVKLQLRVEAPGQPAFEVRRAFRFSQFAIPSQGSVLPVIFDPDDHEKMMLDPDPPIAAPAAGGAGLGGLDLLAQVQAAQAEAGADKEKLAGLLRERLGGAAVVLGPGDLSSAVPAVAGAAPADPLDRLEKLGHLRDQGILTPDEFEAQKKKILGET
jgi:Short C-terminal domain